MKMIQDSNASLKRCLKEKEQNAESVRSVVKDLTQFVHGEEPQSECKKCKQLKNKICDVCKLKQEIQSIKPKERDLKKVSEWTRDEKKLVLYSTSAILLLSALMQYMFK